MGSPEIGRVIPVNTTQTNPDAGIDLSVHGERYTPRALNPTTTTDHEGIHAGLGEDGEVQFVTNVPGPGYKGLTRFRRPNALAAIGPHAVGAHGTSWDVMIAHHVSGGSKSLESSARNAVIQKHAEIVEISDALAVRRTLSGKDVDSARKRARMKEKYGDKATISVSSKITGEKLMISGVKVDGDKVLVPGEIVNFSARLEQRRVKEEAEKTKAAAKAQELEHVKELDKQNVTEQLVSVRAELAKLHNASQSELDLAA